MTKEETLKAGFFFERRYLSNMYQADVTYEDFIYPSVENAYQASKTTSLKLRNEFRELTPEESKQKAKHIPFKLKTPNHRRAKVVIMYQLVLDKFLHHEDLKEKLIATENEILVEFNYWGDRFWGVDGHGQNTLGLILMSVRSTLLTLGR